MFESSESQAWTQHEQLLLPVYLDQIRTHPALRHYMAEWTQMVTDEPNEACRWLRNTVDQVLIEQRRIETDKSWKSS